MTLRFSTGITHYRLQCVWVWEKLTHRLPALNHTPAVTALLTGIPVHIAPTHSYQLFSFPWPFCLPRSCWPLLCVCQSWFVPVPLFVVHGFMCMFALAFLFILVYVAPSWLCATMPTSPVVCVIVYTSALW